METKIDFFLKQLKSDGDKNKKEQPEVQYDDSLTKYWLNYETMRLYLREVLREKRNEMHIL